jgi:tRNA 2-thiocytidine biosynthesis protein TtcA
MRPVREYFGGVLRLVRPLCYLPEKDLARFARACGFPPPPPECPRGGHSQREAVRDLLRRVPKEYRNVRANLLRAGLRGGE